MEVPFDKVPCSFYFSGLSPLSLQRFVNYITDQGFSWKFPLVGFSCDKLWFSVFTWVSNFVVCVFPCDISNTSYCFFFFQFVQLLLVRLKRQLLSSLEFRLQTRFGFFKEDILDCNEIAFQDIFSLPAPSNTSHEFA